MISQENRKFTTHGRGKGKTLLPLCVVGELNFGKSKGHGFGNEDYHREKRKASDVTAEGNVISRGDPSGGLWEAPERGQDSDWALNSWYRNLPPWKNMNQSFFSTRHLKRKPKGNILPLQLLSLSSSWDPHFWDVGWHRRFSCSIWAGRNPSRSLHKHSYRTNHCCHSIS